MNDIDKEILAFEASKDDLLKHHPFKFVIFFDGKLQGSFDSFDAAAKDAISRFGRGPFLIRQVGVEPNFPMPASVAFRQMNAAS